MVKSVCRKYRKHLKPTADYATSKAKVLLVSKKTNVEFVVHNKQGDQIYLPFFLGKLIIWVTMVGMIIMCHL